MSSDYTSTQTSQQPEILALTYPESNSKQAPPPLYPDLKLDLATQELTPLPSEPQPITTLASLDSDLPATEIIQIPLRYVKSRTKRPHTPVESVI